MTTIVKEAVLAEVNAQRIASGMKRMGMTEFDKRTMRVFKATKMGMFSPDKSWREIK